MREIELADRGPWKVRGRKVIYQNAWITLYEDQIITPRGVPGVYGWIDMVGAVGVIALTPEREIYLVGQHRYATNEYAWSLPAGGLKPGEPILDGAKRELREETGLTAATWTSLGHTHPINGVLSEVFHIFLAEDLTQGDPEPDESEDLQVRRLPLNEALAMVQRSEISDSFTCVAVYKAWHHLFETTDKHR